MTIKGIEISPSDRADCNECGRKIGEGEPRAYRLHPKYGSAYYYCYRCSEKEILDSIRNLNNEIGSLKKLKIELAKKIKESSKSILANEIKGIGE